MQNFEGKVIIGPRTGSRTEDFHIPDRLAPDLDGIKVTAVDTLREDLPLTLAKGGTVQIWSELLETRWKSIETTAQGRPVVVQRDNQQYWAAWPDEDAMELWFENIL